MEEEMRTGQNNSGKQGSKSGWMLSTLSSARNTFRSNAEEGICQATISFSVKAPKLLVLEAAERVAPRTLVRHVKGIGDSFVVEGGTSGVDGLCVQTDGVNFEEAWRMSNRVDVNRVRTNDVQQVLNVYGIEAARATLIHEIRAVFGAYGIGVDYRHLSIIADWMTFMVGCPTFKPAVRLVFSCLARRNCMLTGRIPVVLTVWYYFQHFTNPQNVI